jgi:hypothetical protein
MNRNNVKEMYLYFLKFDGRAARVSDDPYAIMFWPTTGFQMSYCTIRAINNYKIL